MKISVVIPTYRRPQDLARCLKALQNQTRPADEVLVIVRDTDTETWSFLEVFNFNLYQIRTATVKFPGVVAAMNIGLEQSRGEIIVFTDDDAAPHTDWLTRIEAHFLSDDEIGGVGGRDWVYFGTQPHPGAPRKVVGQIQWFGRVIGNHHLGIGESRQVDVLKGVNMSFRRSAIAGLRFDQRLRGTGAQVHFEIAFCQALKRSGWQLIYDPLVAVDHHRGQRFDEDQRDQFNHIAIANAVHNETLILLEYLPPLRRAIFILWAVLIGTRDAMGFLQGLRFLPSLGFLGFQKCLASLQGRWQGCQTWQKNRFNKKIKCI